MIERCRNILLVCLAVAVPAPLVAQQNAAPMSPSDRAAAQAHLQSQANEVFNTPIDTARGELRTAMTGLRDTLQTVDGNASRILRAHAVGQAAVVLSGARVLAAQCRGSDSVAARTLTHLAAMRTSSAVGDRLIGNYRTAVTTLRGTLGTCHEMLAAAVAAPTPDLAAIVAQVRAVDAAARAHDAAMQALADGLQIYLLPKGYVPQGHQGH